MRISSLTTALALACVILVSVPPVSVYAEDAAAEGEQGNNDNNNDAEGEQQQQQEQQQENNNEDGNDQQAEQDENNDNANNNTNNNNNNADQDYNGGNDDWNAIQAEYAGDDYIKYWDGYAVLPKSCVTMGGQDVVVFSVFENGYKQCSNSPLGTYYVPVQYFLQAYLQQVEANQIDMGNEDYELPAESVYSECTYKAVNGVDYYVMAGCDDTDRHQLAVNIYSDNTCETPSKNAAGMDDANIDISDIQIPFQQCQQCVIWMDVNDDEVDDKYYENKQISAPLCSKVWSLKEKCGMKCKRLSKEKGAGRSWWNGSDVILLLAMSAFAGGMLTAIVKKRRKIIEKGDALLADPTGVEKRTAAVDAVPTKTLYMAFGGVFGLFIICALFAAKKLTWFLIICLNVCLFGYLLKLVLDYSAMVEDDEDDDDDDEDDDDDDEDVEKSQTTSLPQFS